MDTFGECQCFVKYFYHFLLFIIGSKGGHLFKEQNFTSLQWCDKCGKCLWGLHRQGVLCSECGYQCHRKCMFDTVVVCPRRRVRVRRESDADGEILHLLVVIIIISKFVISNTVEFLSKLL